MDEHAIEPVASGYPYRSARMSVYARNIVATSQPLAAQAGLDALRRGGNAMDAALTAAIALTVVEPTSNGIGSDAFALVWDDEGLAGFNGSGRSPAAWSPARFAGRSEMPKHGWDAVTVPGAVDAWAQLSRAHGTLRFAELFGPAIRYARDGFHVSPITADRWASALSTYAEFTPFLEHFCPDGRAPRAGERFRSPDQAATLEAIAWAHGESFYRGDIAREMVRDAAAHGGGMSLRDLASHRGTFVEPIGTDYRDHRLHEIPPNGQGLAALIALGILNHIELGALDPDSPESLHLQIEAMKVGLAEIARHLADPAAMEMTPAEFLDPARLASRADGLDPRRVAAPTPSPSVDRGTVYLTVADETGMMVSFIQSNFWGFGSGVVVPGTGISLQNRGYGFSLERGHPNEVGSGKRPYHTIIPGFLTKGDEPVMAFGVMGGHMQAQGHVQMTVRVVDHAQNPQAASDAPRWMVTETGQVALESGVPRATVARLRELGHRVVHGAAEGAPAALFGGAQLIRRLDDGAYVAGSDHRKDGAAVGY